MSIIISNDGSNPTAVGEHGYTVKINDKLICAFTHTREEGLSQCLRRAADAVAKEEVLKWVEVTNPRVIKSPFNPEYN